MRGSDIICEFASSNRARCTNEPLHVTSDSYGQVLYLGNKSINRDYLMAVQKVKVKWSDFTSWREEKTATIPDASGVYEFWVDQKNDDKRRIYVGKADNLKTIYLSHLGAEETNECLKNHLKQHVWYYRFAIISIKADREDAELGLYRKHPYECNKVEPPGSGRKDFVIDEDP